MLTGIVDIFMSKNIIFIVKWSMLKIFCSRSFCSICNLDCARMRVPFCCFLYFRVCVQYNLFENFIFFFFFCCELFNGSFFYCFVSLSTEVLIKCFCRGLSAVCLHWLPVLIVCDCIESRSEWRDSMSGKSYISRSIFIYIFSLIFI